MRTSLLIFCLSITFACRREYVPVTNLNGDRITALGHAGLGLSGGYPTNSTESIRKVLELGLDGSELDVQMTSDSVLVAFHDADLSHSTNLSGIVNSHTWDELRDGQYTNELFKSYDLVSLDELFSQLGNPSRYTFTFDCKLYTQQQDRVYYHEMFIRAIVRLAEKYALQPSLCIESQDRDFLSRFQTGHPEYRLFIYPGTFEDGLQTAQSLHLYGITIDNDLITKDQVALAHAQGIRVALWGVHSAAQNKDAVSKDPDYIQTDRPRNLMKVLGR